MKFEKCYWGVLLLLCVCIVHYSLLTDQVFWAADTGFHLNRIEGIKEGLMTGQFPVRMYALQNAGYGEPIGVFYPSLFLYIPAILEWCGVPLGIAYNSLLFCSVVMAAFLAWYAYTLISKSIRVGAIAAVFYITFWYFLFDVYVRAAVGEILAMAFFPLALSSTLYVLYENERKWPLMVISYTGILQAHLLSSLFLIVGIILVFLFSWQCFLDKQHRIAVIKALGVTLLLNLWFIVPFLVFYQTMDVNMQSSAAIIYKHVLDVSTLAVLQIHWGLPTTFGMLAFLWYNVKKRQMPLAAGIHWATVMAWCGFLLMLISTSLFPWNRIESIPVLHYLQVIQLPYRLLSVTAMCFSFCSAIVLGSVLKNMTAKKQIVMLSVVCIGASFFSTFIFMNTKLSDGTIRLVPITSQNLHQYNYVGMGDYLHKGLTVESLKQENANIMAQLVNKNILVAESFRKDGTTVSFAYHTDKHKVIELPLCFYPGYEADTGTGQALSIMENEHHRLLIALPTGSGTVHIRYAGVPLFHIADGISFVTFVVCITTIGRRKFIRKRNQLA